MPQFRADYTIQADLVLPFDAPRTELERSSKATIILANAPLDARKHVPGLTAEVIGNADDIRDVQDLFRERLATRLDFLGLVTRCRFRILHCNRVLEWEPFKADRKMLAIIQNDPYDPPAPQLLPAFVSTAGQLFQMGESHPELARPLQSFRYGLLAEQPEKQFQYFWAALENLAETTKDDHLVQVGCPQCKTAVFCPQCNSNPTRRKVASEEMKDIIVAAGASDGEKMFRILSKVRNHLSHGRTPSTVEDEAKISLPAAVDMMATAAWRGIMQRLPPFPGATIAPNDSVVALTGSLISEVSYRVPDGTEQPSEAQIPAIKLEMLTRFGPETVDGQQPAGGT